MTRQYDAEEIDAQVRSFAVLLERLGQHIEYSAAVLVALWFALNALVVVAAAEWHFGSLLGGRRWSATMVCLSLVAVTLLYWGVLTLVHHLPRRRGPSALGRP